MNNKLWNGLVNTVCIIPVSICAYKLYKHIKKTQIINKIKEYEYKTKYLYLNGDSVNNYNILKYAFQNYNNITLIIDSCGGNLDSTAHIISNIHEYQNGGGIIHGVVLNNAQSAATQILMSMNTIYMDKYAVLSPFDAQITFNNSIRHPVSFLQDDISTSEINDIIHKKYSEQFHKNSKIILDTYSYQYNLLPINKKIKFVEFFISGKIEHSFPITRSVLKSFGIKVCEPCLEMIEVSSLFEQINQIQPTIML